MQVMLDSSNFDGQNFRQIVHTCQRGAIIGVSGHLGRTAAGEFTLVANQFSHLASCPQNLPMMNWSHKSTLKDGEVRFSKRYLDLTVNYELKKFFMLRAKIIRHLRHFLEERDFLEVETPILNGLAGGALAKPFKTRCDDLNCELELRVAPELFLK